MSRQGVNHCANVAVNETIEIIAGQIDAMIGYPSLRKIIGADTFAAVAAAYLVFARLRLLGILFLHHGVQKRARNTFIALTLFLSWDFSS